MFPQLRSKGQWLVSQYCDLDSSNPLGSLPLFLQPLGSGFHCLTKPRPVRSNELLLSILGLWLSIQPISISKRSWQHVSCTRNEHPSSSTEHVSDTSILLLWALANHGAVRAHITFHTLPRTGATTSRYAYMPKLSTCMKATGLNKFV